MQACFGESVKQMQRETKHVVQKGHKVRQYKHKNYIKNINEIPYIITSRCLRETWCASHIDSDFRTTSQTRQTGWSDSLYLYAYAQRNSNNQNNNNSNNYNNKTITFPTRIRSVDATNNNKIININRKSTIIIKGRNEFVTEAV